MTQLFVNNGGGALAVALVPRVANYTEDITLDAGANIPWATYSSPTPDYVRATLTDGTNHEVINILYSQPTTTATIRTVNRGQEGTTARAWPIGTTIIVALTADTISRAFLRGGSHTPGEQAVSLVPYDGGGTIGATGDGAVAVGYFSLASGLASIAIRGSATADNAVAIGGLASANTALALGSYSEASGLRSTAINNAVAMLDDTVAIYGLPVTCPSDWIYGAGNEFVQHGTGEWVGVSEVLDFTTTQTVLPYLPPGVRFFLSEVGIIVEDAAAVTVQPTVSFGIVGTSGKHVAAIATTGLTAAWKRQRFTSLLSDTDGETALEAKVTAGATATTLMARFYWKGFAYGEPTA